MKIQNLKRKIIRQSKSDIKRLNDVIKKYPDLFYFVGAATDFSILHFNYKNAEMMNKVSDFKFSTNWKNEDVRISLFFNEKIDNFNYTFFCNFNDISARLSNIYFNIYTKRYSFKLRKCIIKFTDYENKLLKLGMKKSLLNKINLKILDYLNDSRIKIPNKMPKSLKTMLLLQ